VPSRKEMPYLYETNKMEKMRQGDVISFGKNDKVIPAWRDRYTVMIPREQI
jgi:hypothetical protein